MSPGVVGSIIAGGYANVGVRSYNLPLINIKSKITSGTVLIKIMNKVIFSESINFSNIVSNINLHSPLVSDSDYAGISELQDYHLSIMYFLSVFYGTEKLSCSIHNKSPSYITDTIDYLMLKMNGEDHACNKLEPIYQLDYRSLRKHSTEKDKINRSIILGFKAGIDSTSFNDAVRRLLYSGFSSDISFILADAIARKKGFYPDERLEEQASSIIKKLNFNP